MKSLPEQVAELLRAAKRREQVQRILGLTDAEYEDARFRAVGLGLLKPNIRVPVNDEKRAAIMEDIERYLTPKSISRKHGVSLRFIEELKNGMELPRRAVWPDMPATAFEDDPRACRPMPGRPILSLRWAS